MPVYKDDFKWSRHQQECCVRTLQWVSEVNRLNSLIVAAYLSLGISWPSFLSAASYS